MSYLNGQIGYREELLSTRSIIKKENYVVLETDGLVKNSIPGYEKCDITILGSPSMGASFADYIATVYPEGKNTGIGNDGIECFLYVIEGELNVSDGEKDYSLITGGYIYTPCDKTLSFENTSTNSTRVYIYRRRYEKLAGYSAFTVVGNEKELPKVNYEGMETCQVQDFLPAAGNFGFDMNMHILRFQPGASHGYIETHIQEHGMYFLQGKAMYFLDNEWMPLKEGDYVFMDSYVPQACYGVGDEELVYIYSKDCNREVKL